jgi:hypothetical protein
VLEVEKPRKTRLPVLVFGLGPESLPREDWRADLLFECGRVPKYDIDCRFFRPEHRREVDGLATDMG